MYCFLFFFKDCVLEQARYVLCFIVLPLRACGKYVMRDSEVVFMLFDDNHRRFGC